MFYRDTSPYGDNMKIDITRDSDDEGGRNGRILRSFNMNLVDSNSKMVAHFTFGAPVEISFNYEDAVQAAPGFNSQAEEALGIGLFWHNGVEYVKIGGRVNTAAKTVSIRSKNLGKYRIMSVVRAV